MQTGNPLLNKQMWIKKKVKLKLSSHTYLIQI